MADRAAPAMLQEEQRKQRWHRASVRLHRTMRRIRTRVWPIDDGYADFREELIGRKRRR